MPSNGLEALREKLGDKQYSKVFLDLWEECLGVLRGIEVGRFEVVVLLSQTDRPDMGIVFPVGSSEAEALKRQLNDGLIGKKLAILRVDDPRNPIRVKKSE